LIAPAPVGFSSATRSLSTSTTRPDVSAVCDNTLKQRLYVTDRTSGRPFLIDSGATVSCLPATALDRLNDPTGSLAAINTTGIRTWGTRTMCLLLGGRRYNQDFQVCEVSEPLLGADFFAHHGMAIDFKTQRLISMDGHYISCRVSSADASDAVMGLHKDNPYDALLAEFPELLVQQFTGSNKHGVEHFIVTEGPPVFAKARRLDPDKLKAAEEKFRDMEADGIVRRSNSPWASPLHMVPKADGSWRPCGDFRRLNKITTDDRYPLPHIQTFADKLAGAKWFSKVDLYRGYHNVPMEAASIPKTAVITPFGLFEFLRMPFGLKNAAQVFQRLMDGILRGLTCAFVYLDDVLVASATEQQHLADLRDLFTLLSANGLVVNSTKCVLGVRELDFLGHRVSAAGYSPLPERVEAIKNFEVPSSKAALQRFLGLINFYHHFIPGVARHLGPLNAATAVKGQLIIWSDECQAAFTAAKSALSTATLLVFPDPAAETSLTTDASDTAVGAVVEQRRGTGPWRPVCFMSKKLSPAQSRYSTFDRELLAVYLGVEKCRPYLEGKPFTIFTDHKPLLAGFAARADRTPRQARHLAYISEFSTNLKHVEGKNNVVADALSRSSLAAITRPQDRFDHVALAKAQTGAVDIAECRARTSTGLHLVDIAVAPDVFLLCDDSLGSPRPVVPTTWRRRVFDAIHGLAHQGPKPTLRAISSRYVWHGLRRDVALWCRDCHACQAAKITRHVKAPLVPPPAPDRRFADINVDLVGPLPSSNGFVYLFTVIDRFTRWPTAIPITDASAATCARALLDGWIANFGVPDSVTSDRGAQFTSTLWREFNDIMGTDNVNQTTSYHPQANGLVERFHRQLKDALKARGANANWSQHLWAVLLGIRSVWRAGPDCSSAELVYGTTLKVPGEFVDVCRDSPAPTASFVADLKSDMSMVRPVAAEYHGVGPISVPASLSRASHVYVRHDARRKPLQAPYDGPFRVLERHAKHFLLELNGRRDVVSIDRLKPAHGVVDVPAAAPTTPPAAPLAAPPSPNSTRRTYAEMVATSPKITRSGRVVLPPVKFPAVRLHGVAVGGGHVATANKADLITNQVNTT